MDNCEKYQEMISRMLDGDLSPDEEAALRAHMADCPECRLMFEAFSGISDALGSDLAEPPAELVSGTMFKIRALGAKKRRFRWGRYAAIAACFAVIVFAASRAGMLTGGMGKSESPKMMAAPAAAPAPAAGTTAASEPADDEACAESFSLGAPAEDGMFAGNGLDADRGLCSGEPAFAELYDAAGAPAASFDDTDAVLAVYDMLGYADPVPCDGEITQPEYTLYVSYPDGGLQVIYLRTDGEKLVYSVDGDPQTYKADRAEEFLALLKQTD